MKKIKIKFEIAESFQEYLYEKLAHKYQFIISEKPDYVFFEASSMHKCYQYDCVRMLFIGENIRPDFNLFDYACGFDQMKFGDRYLYYPLYCNNRYREETELIFDKHIRAGKLLDKKDKFCNFVVSNGNNTSIIREEFFHALNKYSKVDSAGAFLNNMPGNWTIPRGNGVDGIKELNRFRESYRFTLAFENSRYSGYTTEKIVRAFSGVTIPIYWGDPEIKRQFNPKAFIDISDFGSFDEAIGYIAKVNENSELWQKMLLEPALPENSNVIRMMEDSYLLDFLENIFDQPLEKALRRTNKDDGWGYHYEKRCQMGQEMISDRMLNVAYRVKKRIKKLL